MDVKTKTIYIIIFSFLCIGCFLIGRCTKKGNITSYNKLKDALTRTRKEYNRITELYNNSKQELNRIGKIQSTIEKLNKELKEATNRSKAVTNSLKVKNTDARKELETIEKLINNQ